MELTVKLSTDTTKGIYECAMFGKSLVMFARDIAEFDEASRMEDGKNNVEVPEENQPATCATEDKPEAPKTEQEAKPKRRRKTQTPSEPAPESPKDTEPDNGELPCQPEDIASPSTAEPAPTPTDIPAQAEQPAPAPTTANTEICTLEDFRKAFASKLDELKLNDGQENAALRPVFNDFVHRLSEPYGDSRPSKLTDTQRGDFIRHFNSIRYVESSNGFESTYCPF